MTLRKIVTWGYYCLRCGHRWVPRGTNVVYRAMSDEKQLGPMDPGEKPDEPEEPKVCPTCKSPYWNRDRLKS